SDPAPRPPTPPAPGRVVSVDVGLGQKVTPGQVLARLETASGPVDLKAPREATVGRVSVAPGAQVVAGQAVVSVRDPEALPSLYVLLPGEYRSELAPGMTLEYRMERMPEPLETVIEAVEGPEASLQYARARKAEDSSREDGVVLVRAHVPSRSFIRDEQSRLYQDGSTGSARVKLGTQRLLVAWFPGLRHALP
ncbi:acetyl-CoA carboxylase biotin carboxyl carrier protein subunit, partial [Corallococcus sp. CA047B]|uniref:acetyl-CoA carboxylase biotin carboxyl carrier protein subunit n=1 Tax=Corallococcus sp. CA047B TaxID=2316729 RepID=UPI0011C47AA3